MTVGWANTGWGVAAAALSKEIVPPEATRAERFLSAIETAFGPVARDPKERTLRFLEEAIELAQAAGLTRHMVDCMTERVYGKSPGIIAEELGQCLNTLELVGVVYHVDVQDAADFQLMRFLSKPLDYWRERQARKKALGLTADAE